MCTNEMWRRLGVSAAAVVLATLALAALASPASAQEIQIPAAVSERIDAGLEHTCAIDDDGEVHCWGSNLAGQLGYGNSAQAGKARIGDNETPASAGAVDLGGVDAWKVATGLYHSAILVDRSVACWGLNTSGTLGSGNQDPEQRLHRRRRGAGSRARGARPEPHGQGDRRRWQSHLRHHRPGQGDLLGQQRVRSAGITDVGLNNTPATAPDGDVDLGGG